VILSRYLPDEVVHHLLEADPPYSPDIDLTQETVYESLLFAQRRDIHRQIANHLRGSTAESDPGLLAHHYRRAEAWPEALEYAWQAGQRAQSLYAGDIALGHYQQALEAAERIDNTTAAQRRAELLRRIGEIYTLAGRYADAVGAYETALAGSSDDHQRAEVLMSWAAVYEQQANYDDALALLARGREFASPPPAQPTLVAFEITAAASGQEFHHFANNHQLTVDISYTDADVAGADPQKLIVYTYDETLGAWSFAGIHTTVHPAKHRIVARLEHLSRFSVTSINIKNVMLPVIMR